MFTGIVQAVGRIAQCESRGGDMRLRVDVGPLAQRIDATRLAIGESVAINGACLTVVQGTGSLLDFDVSRETLRLTTLHALTAGARVNLEAALRMGDPLGGHLMSGHVDGLARVVSMHPDARSLRVRIAVPGDLACFIATKGSVALDGVSLTVNEVEGVEFGINLIPHTIEATTFDELSPGRELNIEVDRLARYAQRLLLQSPP
ncbi:MAG: riboflavin synthase [Nevskiaceae bacterium]|jgi:riboflavin synthase|nr:riboflavin synthase [Nevskiaceae bacterium]